MENLQEILHHKLDALKAKDVVQLDVRHISDYFSHLIIATATSSRHAQSILQHLSKDMKHEYRLKTPQVQGDQDAQWLLIDFGSVVLHIMQAEARLFYNLEKLWAPVEIH
jgi:ribosome-associated protein